MSATEMTIVQRPYRRRLLGQSLSMVTANVFQRCYLGCRPLAHVTYNCLPLLFPRLGPVVPLLQDV